MRAVQVHAAGEPGEVVRVDEVPIPEPGPGQLRIRVGAAALNFPDVMMCRRRYQLRPQYPFTPGLEAAGFVTAVGDGVDHRWLGRRAVGVPELPYGGLAEEAMLVAARAYEIPDGVDDASAASTLIAFQTAHVALHRRGAIRDREWVLVHAAAGGVGTAAIQVARLAGARVVAVAGGAEKVARAMELGAQVGIDTKVEDFVEAVRACTDGRGADVVFDPVGGSTLARTLECAAREARILIVGFAGGDLALPAAQSVLYQNISLVGVYVGGYSQDDDGRRYLAEVQRSVFADLRSGRIRTVVSRRVDLDGVADALTDLAERRVVGKVVVVPAGW